MQIIWLEKIFRTLLSEENKLQIKGEIPFWSVCICLQNESGGEGSGRKAYKPLERKKIKYFPSETKSSLLIINALAN